MISYTVHFFVPSLVVGSFGPEEDLLVIHKFLGPHYGVVVLTTGRVEGRSLHLLWL